jgi:mannose-6-phosphate isomerase-like protein (cupin superfamily)
VTDIGSLSHIRLVVKEGRVFRNETGSRVSHPELSRVSAIWTSPGAVKARSVKCDQGGRMSQPVPSYRFYEAEKYGKGAVIYIAAEVASREGEWFNQTLTTVNDSAVRLSVMNGEYHWHKHEAADEFFLVMEGTLFIDIADGETVVLGPQCAYAVPRGVIHRTRAQEPCIAVVVDAATAAPAGD